DHQEGVGARSRSRTGGYGRAQFTEPPADPIFSWAALAITLEFPAGSHVNFSSSKGQQDGRPSPHQAQGRPCLHSNPIGKGGLSLASFTIALCRRAPVRSSLIEGKSRPASGVTSLNSAGFTTLRDWPRRIMEVRRCSFV